MRLKENEDRLAEMQTRLREAADTDDQRRQEEEVSILRQQVHLLESQIAAANIDVIPCGATGSIQMFDARIFSEKRQWWRSFGRRIWI